MLPLLLISAALLAGASALNAWMVPIKVYVRGATLADISIDMCEVNWAEYKKNPTAYPLNQDIMRVSNCNSGSTIERDVKFAVLEAEYSQRCKPTSDGAPASLLCEPAGIIQHEARGAFGWDLCV
jgi:hypothetical protein